MALGWMLFLNISNAMSRRIARRCSLLVLAWLLACSASFAQKLPDAPSAQKAKQPASKPATDQGWPRTFVKAADTFTIYQPQVEKWDGNRISSTLPWK